jgi:hypothetical protein
MPVSPKVCKKCKKLTSNFQKESNVWCLSCREAAFEETINGQMAKLKLAGSYCSACGKQVWETYGPQHLCSMCSFATKLAKPAIHQVSAAVEQKKKEIVHAVHSASVAEANAIKQKMQKGEISRLATNSSALWTEQWAVQGSGKIPYIVSHKKDGEWQCSCPAWTTTTPREDCKHILKVKLYEKVPMSKTTVFTKQVIQVDTNAGMALKSFEKKGRKFR